MAEQASRSRRRRGGRRDARAAAGAGGEQHAARAGATEWRWRTFPVAFAFVLGGFVFLALSALGLGAPLFYLALFGVSFGVAHMIVRSLRGYRR